MYAQVYCDDDEAFEYIKKSPYKDVLREALIHFFDSKFKKGHLILDPLVEFDVPEALFFSACFSKKGEGHKGKALERFEERHFSLIKQAASYGFSLALYSLGYAYDFAGPFPRDEFIANTYFKRAALAGHVHSMYLFGMTAYYCKDTIFYNKEQGYFLLKTAAMQGHGDAVELLRKIDCISEGRQG